MNKIQSGNTIAKIQPKLGFFFFFGAKMNKVENF